MSLRMRFGMQVALAAALTLGSLAVGTAARAEEACAPGQERDGQRCMHQIAPPGPCATARSGSAGGGGGGGGGDCSEGAVGAASTRFAPGDVATNPTTEIAFQPPAPGPGPGPDLQPCDIGCGGGPGGPAGPPAGPPVGPPAGPPIVVIESPAVPDPPPGLFK